MPMKNLQLMQMSQEIYLNVALSFDKIFSSNLLDELNHVTKSEKKCSPAYGPYTNCIYQMHALCELMPDMQA